MAQHNTRHNDIQHKEFICDTQHNRHSASSAIMLFVTFHIAECHHADCRCAECRGASVNISYSHLSQIYNEKANSLTIGGLRSVRLRPYLQISD